MIRKKSIMKKTTVKKIIRVVILALIIAILPAEISYGQSELSVVERILGDQPGDYVFSLRLIIILTILTLLPSILIMMTSFTRIIIVLSFIRNSLGLQQTPPNQVFIGIALFLTIFIMAPIGSEINSQAIQPYLNEEISMEDAFDKGIEPIREFMFRQTRNKDLGLFLDISGTEADNLEDIPNSVLIPSFIISELKTAFQIGFVIYIPFLIIDMVVASTLMSMGMMMLPPVIISLPFKVLLFILVDGWNLITEALVLGFN